MPIEDYRSVLAVPGVRSLSVLGVLARIPHAATSVVATVHVVQVLGRGYGAAGLVVAAWTAGLAVGAPWRGRAVDRVGLRRALAPSLVAEAVLWSAAPWLPFPALLMVVVAAGALALPVFTVVRLALSVMVPPGRRRTAFAVDAVGVEASFILGPALGVLVATQVSSRVAMIGLGAVAAATGIGLMILDPPTVVRAGGARPDPSARARVPASAGMLAVLGASAGATVVLAGTDVSIIASLRATGDLAWTGLVTAVWAAASLLGGLWYGVLRRSVPPLPLLLGLGLLTMPVGLASGPAALALAMLAAGFLCAPVITATAEVVTEMVPDRVRGEAMGWHGSALTAGTAVGAPLAGVWIDRVSVAAGFVVVGGCGAALALVGFVESAVRGSVVAPEPPSPTVGPGPVGRPGR
jgi:MFS family permease